ncbi:MAG: phage holin family protein [Sphingomonas sp.]|nr:phage holin family protein [Sphingomonas sp.]
MPEAREEEVAEKPIGELFGQLIDEGKAYARAELGLARATAEAKAEAARKPALLAGASLLFLIAGVVVLCMSLALGLATLLGPLAGGLVASLITLGVSYGLFLWARQEAGKIK